MSAPKLFPALLGGVFIGVLSALPLVNIANCCCLWIISGGVLAAWVMQQNHPAPISVLEGALVGLLAGVMGAFVYLLVAWPITLGVQPMLQTWSERILEGANDVPPEVREAVARMTGTGASLMLGFLMNFVFGVVFSTLGGVHVAPDLGLFRFLAPESVGLTEDMFNRYAHVRFVMPPETSQLVQADSFQVAVSPCSARLATLWVNHFLASRAATPPPECAAAFEARDAGESRLWSRKHPVGPVGVASSRTPKSALEFDFRAASAVKLTRQRDRLLVEAPPGQRAFATAINLSLIDRIDCDGASAATLDAHVVVTPRGDVPVRCEVRFLGTAGALGRLLGRRSG